MKSNKGVLLKQIGQGKFDGNILFSKDISHQLVLKQIFVLKALWNMLYVKESACKRLSFVIGSLYSVLFPTHQHTNS